MTDLTLRMERTFDAPAQAVFDAWTSVEVLKRWWHAWHDGDTPFAEVDLRVGGTIRLTMRNPDGEEYTGGGEYLEVRPPERLVFTWVWDDGDDSPARIELDFTERDGRTTLVLTQIGLKDDESRRSYEGGWGITFDNLALVLEES
jgi:uncharacterized protein YndB with AHSA1/START domain